MSQTPGGRAGGTSGRRPARGVSGTESPLGRCMMKLTGLGVVDERDLVDAPSRPRCRSAATAGPTRSGPAPPGRPRRPTGAGPSRRSRRPAGSSARSRSSAAGRQRSTVRTALVDRRAVGLGQRRRGSAIGVPGARPSARDVVERRVDGRRVVGARPASTAPPCDAALERDDVRRRAPGRRRRAASTVPRTLAALGRRLDRQLRRGHRGVCGVARRACGRALSRTTARYSHGVPGGKRATSWKTRYGALSSVPMGCHSPSPTFA